MPKISIRLKYRAPGPVSRPKTGSKALIIVLNNLAGEHKILSGLSFIFYIKLIRIRLWIEIRGFLSLGWNRIHEKVKSYSQLCAIKSSCNLFKRSAVNLLLSLCINKISGSTNLLLTISVQRFLVV